MPLAVLQIITAQGIRQSRIDQAEATALSRVATMASQQRIMMDAIVSNLHTIGVVPAVAAIERDRSACEETLRMIVANEEGYDSAAVTDAEGMVVCSSYTAADRPVTFADRAWFRDLQNNPQEPMIGEQVISRLNGRRILPVAVARMTGGKFNGAISIGIDASYLQKTMEMAVEGPGVSASLADRQGNVIATIPYSEKYIGTSMFDSLPAIRNATAPAVTRMVLESGAEWLVTYYPASAPPLRGLNMVFNINLTALTRPLDDVRNLNLGAMAILLLAAVATAYFGARLYVVRSIQRLQDVAARWRFHDFSPRMQVQRQSDELVPLAISLNAMAEELAQTLEQKDLMLREINHRVMNSMQIISSLLMMQSRRVGSQSVVTPLMSAVERINALGTVHRRLHLSASVGTLDLGVFVRDLVSDVGRALGDEHTKIESIINAAPLISVDDAIAIGLILNETITNAVKHAKASETPNRVRVTLDVDESLRAVLSVEDTGGGNVDWGRVDTSSLGMVVIESLSRRLKAAVQFQTTPLGVRVVMRWVIVRLPPVSTEAA